MKKKKNHKEIMDERHAPMARLLEQRAPKLPRIDPRRMAYFANKDCPFARTVVTGLPVPSAKFSPSEWLVTIALHFGLPIRMLKPFVGEKIQSHPNHQQLRVDAAGHNLLTVTGVQGSGRQRNHNGVGLVLAGSLADAGIPHLGGGSQRTCKRLFKQCYRGAAINSVEEERELNGIIPDILIKLGHLPRDEDSSNHLKGFDHLADIKTLAPGAIYVSGDTESAHAVARRQKEVKREYSKKAEKLDRKFHNTPPGTVGPFSRVLRDYGVQGEVLGLVVGAFGEVSQDVHHLRDVVAEKLVEIHTSYFKIPTNRAKSFVVNLLTRKWGHSIARGWARLLLERLRENVDLPADLKSFATNPDAIETEDEEEFANALLSHLNPQNLSWAQGFPTSGQRV
jgi:hypothetical protein